MNRRSRIRSHRFPYNRNHHWYGHRVSNFAEFTASNCRGSHSNWCGDEHRWQREVDAVAGNNGQKETMGHLGRLMLSFGALSCW